MTRSAPLRLVAALLQLSSLIACSSSPPQVKSPPERAAPLPPSSEEETEAGQDELDALPARPWAESTFSPQPGSVPDPELEAVAHACGQSDAALHDVAQWVAEAQAQIERTPSLDAIQFELRKRGSPYVMPRLWTAQARGVELSEIENSVSSWARSRAPRGELRCGVGLAEQNRMQFFVVLQVDVAAELAPLPTQVETGEWVELNAHFLLPTTAASVLLLPPQGSPRTLNTQLEQQRARARFLIDTPGTWLVQIMATQEGGPLPVASALLSAGVERPARYDARPVPGEHADDPELSAEEALFAMVNAARQDQGLTLLRRNPQLDRAARQHSQRMLEQGRISHDTGHGNPARRVEMMGLHPRATGENVALAASPVRLHRALWNSPSHRENILHRPWSEVGIGIVQAEDGSLFATQLFMDNR